MKKIFFLIILLFNLQTFAWEVDDYTYRIEILKQTKTVIDTDLQLLNNQTNFLIQKAIKVLNDKENFSCEKDRQLDVPEIYETITDQIGGLIIGRLEEWAISNLHTFLSEKDIFNAIFYDPRPSFNLSNHVVGVDKLSHFFDQGFTMFKTAYLRPDFLHKLFQKYFPLPQDDQLTQQQIMAFYISYLLEETFLGKRMSGILSYADMGANYSGMIFWMHLLHGNNPYLECNKITKKYKQLKSMDWENYVNHSWDEGINCSFFNNYPIDFPYNNSSFKKEHYFMNMSWPGKNFQKNLSVIYETKYNNQKTFKLNRNCPIETEKCLYLATIPCAKYIISPMCLVIANNKINQECKLGSSLKNLQ